MKETRTFIACYVMACVMISGCGNVYNHRGFGAQRGINFVDGIRSTAYISPQSKTYGIPAIFEYENQTGPYDLSLMLQGISQEIDSFEVNEIRLKYADGEVVDKTLWWKENFRSRAERNALAGKANGDHAAVGETMNGLLDRHEDVTITLKGRVTKSNGEVVDFVAKESFQAERSLSFIPMFLHGA